eukprot:gene15846-11933_t
MPPLSAVFPQLTQQRWLTQQAAKIAEAAKTLKQQRAAAAKGCSSKGLKGSAICPVAAGDA